MKIKWVLLLRTPFNRNWIVVKREGVPALMPIEKNIETNIKDVYGYDTEDLARIGMQEIADLSPITKKLISRIIPIKGNEIYGS